MFEFFTDFQNSTCNVCNASGRIDQAITDVCAVFFDSDVLRWTLYSSAGSGSLNSTADTYRIAELQASAHSDGPYVFEYQVWTRGILYISDFRTIDVEV